VSEPSAANGAEQTRSNFGWKIAWAAFLVALFAWGLGFYGPSVFLEALHDRRGWSVSTISSAITLHFLWSALLITYLPEAHRRFGTTRITQAGLAISALGILGWANAAAPWQMFVVALVSGAGWAATSGAAINALVAPWFDRDRPQALSLAFNGASCGGLLFTPLWVALIAQFGFPLAAALIGAGMIAIMAPVSIQILSAKPPAPAGAANAQVDPQTRAQLMRRRSFITISLAFALALFAQVGIIAHLVARLAPQFGAQGAAFTMSLITVSAVVGRTLLGWMMGEGDRRLAAALNFAVQAIGTLLFTFGQDAATQLAGCVLFGLGLGNLVSLPPLLVQQEFARTDVGKVVALMVAINQAVFAFAPAVLGIIRDLAGSYTLSFLLAAAMQMLSALVVLFGRASHQPR